ncbi:hypothetical protein EMCG_01122 [[Emmonsia] crescens]|uniref:Uncharacterized protein n=1 Tax=[Emmonsia] crescens TaxID=73230 RepID=A0A0G2I7Q4_9EURO|nr:hypothetical protein EMCG_01122 [Emmonsia crescens UAMH 3008]
MRFASIASGAVFIASAAAGVQQPPPGYPVASPPQYSASPPPSDHPQVPPMNPYPTAAPPSSVYPGVPSGYPEVPYPSSAHPVEPSASETDCDEDETPYPTLIPSSAHPVEPYPTVTPYPTGYPSSAYPAEPSASETDCDEDDETPYPTLTATVIPTPPPKETHYPTSGYPVETAIVTSYTTFCPAPTTITYGTHTYTVTEPTTLTMTGPITIVRPILSSTVVKCTDCPYPTAIPTAPTFPTGGYMTSVQIPPPVDYPTAGYPSPSGTIPTGKPSPPPYMNGASRGAVNAGAGLAGLLALAAYLL